MVVSVCDTIEAVAVVLEVLMLEIIAVLLVLIVAVSLLAAMDCVFVSVAVVAAGMEVSVSVWGLTFFAVNLFQAFAIASLLLW